MTVLWVLAAILALGLAIQVGVAALQKVAEWVRYWSKRERDLRRLTAENRADDAADPEMARRVERFMRDL